MRDERTSTEPGNLVVGLFGYGVSLALNDEVRELAMVLDPGQADEVARRLHCLAARARDELDHVV